MAQNSFYLRGSVVDSRSCLVVLVVANGANFAVLAQGLGETCGICSARGQFLSLSDPGKTPLPVRIALNLRHLRVSLANGTKSAQFMSNSFYLSAKD